MRRLLFIFVLILFLFKFQLILAIEKSTSLSCYDTDLFDTRTVGVCRDVNAEYVDYCESDITLKEYYCSLPTKCEFMTFDCQKMGEKFKCLGGKCVESLSSCYDSDSAYGSNVLDSLKITGTCRDFYGTHIDSCEDSIVKEYYCGPLSDPKECMSTSYNCKYYFGESSGCLNGRCVIFPTTTIVLDTKTKDHEFLDKGIIISILFFMLIILWRMLSMTKEIFPSSSS
jgi:hypothetical protein